MLYQAKAIPAALAGMVAGQLIFHIVALLTPVAVVAAPENQVVIVKAQILTQRETVDFQTTTALHNDGT